jgi:drug/metabolite transporter (DMT)-like permease
LIALLAVLWSANFIFAKMALRELDAMTLATLRFSLAGAFILPIYLWKRGIPDGISRQDWLFLAISAVSIGGNQFAFVVGLSRTSVAHSSLILALTPVWVLFLSRMLGHEAITFAKLTGFAIAVAGVGILQTRHSAATASTPLGDLLVLIASLMWAAFTVASKAARERLDGLAMNTITYGGTAVAFSPMTVWFSSRVDFLALSWQAWMSLFYMAVFPTLVGVAIYYHAMRYMPATRISMVSYAQPLLATVFAMVALGERITQPVILGGALVILGVVWTERT